MEPQHARLDVVGLSVRMRAARPCLLSWSPNSRQLMLDCRVTRCPYFAGAGHRASSAGRNDMESNEAPGPQQSVTPGNCCGGASCRQWADLWGPEAFGRNIKTLGSQPPALSVHPQPSAAKVQGSGSQTASISGSEQISNYEPVHRGRSLLSSEAETSRSSLGSPRDWQVRYCPF